MSPYWAKPQGCGLGQLLAQEGTMIVYVAFDFPDVGSKTDQGRAILADLYGSLETMRVGFDASESWVSSVVERDDDEAS